MKNFKNYIKSLIGKKRFNRLPISLNCSDDRVDEILDNPKLMIERELRMICRLMSYKDIYPIDLVNGPYNCGADNITLDQAYVMYNEKQNKQNQPLRKKSKIFTVLSRIVIS
jgi:hypothetical protein